MPFVCHAAKQPYVKAVRMPSHSPGSTVLLTESPGQSSLPSSCPVCEHSPVSGDDCTVYKSLRTTIRVFLKTEEKKREAARPKTNGSAPPTPVEQISTPTPNVKPAFETLQADMAPHMNKTTTSEAPADQSFAAVEPENGDDGPGESGENVPQQVSNNARD